MVVVSISAADEVLYEKERLSQKIRDVHVDENCEFSAGQDRLFHLMMLGVSCLSLP